jgi:serine/threonine protein phosphatase PrpC
MLTFFRIVNFLSFRVEICDQDEFIILGCDGIWDCLTNEKAVAYVRSRIDKLRPTEIGVEMLNDIISEDPRATQGIGGDNMTIMIVDLQPSTRSWRQENAVQDQQPERIAPS